MKPGPVVNLSAGPLRLTVCPALGGAVGAFQVKTGKGWFDLFRPLRVPADGRADALNASMFPMVPFANCIRDNQFRFDDNNYRVAANMEGARLNFHGSGWRQPWSVSSQTGDTLTIELAKGIVDDVFRYRARQTLRLAPDGLAVRLSVENCDERRMPFSFGLHPWFARHSQAMVRFSAKGVWHLDQEGQTIEETPLTPESDFHDFRAPRAESWNTCFSGWDGRADIKWPQDHVDLGIRADTVFGHLMAHVPANDFSTFCLEPQTNAPCGFDGLERATKAQGVHILAPGQSVSGEITFHVSVGAPLSQTKESS